MQEEIRNTRENDPKFWEELTRVNPRQTRPTAAICIEDSIPEPEQDDEQLDDTDISLQDVLAATHHEELPAKRRGRTSINEQGGLTAGANAENLDELPVVDNEGVEPVEGGRGKRRKTANKLYSSAAFTRHWDNDQSDVD
jgi:hypothetical protein